MFESPGSLLKIGFSSLDWLVFKDTQLDLESSALCLRCWLLETQTEKNHTFVLCMFLLFGTELLLPQGWVYEAKTCDVFSKCLIFSSSILILNSDHDCVRTEKQWECSAERIVLHSDYYRPLCSLSDQTQIFEAAAERISTEQPLYHIKSDVNACFYVILLTSPTVLMCLLVYSYNETEALLHSFVSKFMLCFLIQIIVSPAKWFILP